MTSASPRTAIVIGASMAGLFTAAALDSCGYRVTVLERDPLSVGPAARKGVPQGSQAHVMLHRGWQAAEALLPGLTQQVRDQGAACFDGGRMPWLGEFGWLSDRLPGFEFVSVTRPLLELVIRRRVGSLPNVNIYSSVRANGLERIGDRWSVATANGPRCADLVVDASGRNSRIPHWLADLDLSVPEAEQLDAHLGYATRVYRSPQPVPLRTGIVIAGTPESGTGGLALPVENGLWLLMGAGYGDRRPPRDAAGFEQFLAGLRDPVLFQLADRLEPVSEVAIHRQTGNRRFRFESLPDWPPGLLVVGDAMAAFNPIYGQGITVAAGQADLLRNALRGGAPADRRLQRRVSAVADLPWAIATAADLRQPSAQHTPGSRERLLGLWIERLARLAATGDPASTLVFSQVNHLVAPTWMLFHPLLIGSALRSLVVPARPLPRPTALDAISSIGQRSTSSAA